MLTAINQPGISYNGVSQAVRVTGGDLLLLTGHVASDEQDNFVEGDFETQVRAAFQAIERTLRAAGVGFEAVARFTYYVTDYEPGMTAVLKKVRAEFIDNNLPPASTFIPVAELYDPRARIEIDGVAVLPTKARIG
jgi:enamine deaminase RidA (YjgF/YER057c/UK114 family)